MKRFPIILCLLLALLAVSAGPAMAEETGMTVIFDLNTTPDLTDNETYVYTSTSYNEFWQPVETESEAIFPAENGVLNVTVADPTREGWYFAGWQTKADVAEADLINGVSPYLWLPGHKANFLGQSMLMTDPEGMAARQMDDEAIDLTPYADEQGTVRLYARWVQMKQIDSPEALQAMANDLYGAYELTADITLSDAFIPVGCYFSNYEFFETAWWSYAFRGTLAGNGHTITGLNVQGAYRDTGKYADTTVWHNDGQTCDGTVGLFGAVAGANLSGFTLKDAVLDIAGEYAYNGGYCYVGAVAAFDMASVLQDIHVENVTIRMEDTESNAVYTVLRFYKQTPNSFGSDQAAADCKNASSRPCTQGKRS